MTDKGIKIFCTQCEQVLLPGEQMENFQPTRPTLEGFLTWGAQRLEDK